MAANGDGGHFDVVRFVYSLSGWLSLGMGLPLNLLLIWLIFNKTVRAMQIYARLLLCSTIIDILLLLVTSTVQPILIADHGYRLLIQNGLFRWIPEPYALILDSIWLQLLVCFDISTTFQFVFRYLLITRDTKIPARITWRLIGLAALANVLHYIVMIWADLPREEYAPKIAQMTRIIAEETGITDVQIASFSVGRSFAWYVHAAFMVVLFFGCYAIIVFCGVKIRHHINTQMKSTGSMEEWKIRDINRQIGRALIIQAILPTFELVAFTLKICLPIFFSTETVFYIIYTAVPLYFIPVLNPLGTILVVKPYRQFVLGKMFLKGEASKVAAITTVTPMHQHRP